VIVSASIEPTAHTSATVARRARERRRRRKRDERRSVGRARTWPAL